MISKTKKFNLGTLILTTYLQMTPVSTANRYDYFFRKRKQKFNTKKKSYTYVYKNV